MRRILLIDDDVELCELLAAFFSGEGFKFSAVHDGPSGIAEALSGNYSVVILDVMLPGRGGFDVLREIRTKSRVPVLMLTAKGEHVDRIVGLELGADDYVPKPFNTRELAARVRAVLRRRRGILHSRPLSAPSTGLSKRSITSSLSRAPCLTTCFISLALYLHHGAVNGGRKS